MSQLKIKLLMDEHKELVDKLIPSAKEVKDMRRIVIENSARNGAARDYMPDLEEIKKIILYFNEQLDTYIESGEPICYNSVYLSNIYYIIDNPIRVYHVFSYLEKIFEPKGYIIDREFCPDHKIIIKLKFKDDVLRMKK